MPRPLVTLFLLPALLAGWELAWWALGVRPITPWRLEELLATNRPQLVDVRTRAEYEWFHIPDSVHLPELLTESEAARSLDPDRPVVLLCMTGHRSSLAGWRLGRQGFQRVFSLTGGTLGWGLTGHEVE